MSKGRPTWVDIDLGALRHNLMQIQARVGPERHVIGVVKANAYGHGAVEVARGLLDAGVQQLAVATVAEGLELRNAGIAAPILVFAGRYGDQAQSLWQADLEAVVFGDDVLDALSAVQPSGSQPLRVHLHIDSGMGRLGCAPSDYEHLLGRIEDSPAFELAGLMTHLACADQSAAPKTAEQLRLFASLTEAKAVQGIPRHAANSAAVAAFGEAWFDAVRPGLALYGVEPVVGQSLGLLPVMHWRTELGHIRVVGAGESVGYGARWVAEKESRIGILPVGYADGYPWCAEGHAQVLLGGRRARVVGAISMDLIAIDLSDHDRVQVGASVVLLGRDGEDEISAHELARWSNRLVYEVLTGVGGRVRRRYRRQEAGVSK